MAANTRTTAEHERLADAAQAIVPPWRRWGCYVTERAWGTVREDYSAGGDAWDYLPHDHARSKAYRWGEDGIAGLCDRYQLLTFAVALWNGRDPILKERMYGLTSSEGNRGEDVKEYYFYLDALPSGAYMKMLYKYPQAEYPYARLLDENRQRGGGGMEFELLDSGVFDEDRYFDVFVEYAKAGPDDICIRIEACNRGPAAATLHLLPQLWFRNTWGWGSERRHQPVITRGSTANGWQSLVADDSNADPPPNLMFEYKLGTRHLYADADATALFTNNETNTERLYGSANAAPYVKDAFHRHVVHGEACVNPEGHGTKAALHFTESIPARSSKVWHLRLTNDALQDPLASVEAIVMTRRREADEFYETVHPPKATADEKLVQRQALAGMLWTKQIYLFDVQRWLKGDNPNMPPPESRHHIRNVHWKHLNSMRILSMPDKWEYPWFAAWDLAFHCVAISLVDPAFSKENLWVLLFEQFQHPNGQLPAYEWEFSDLNPPVHAWACWRVYNIEKDRHGKADTQFLEKCFQKLLINFAWWVNKVDSQGLNVFEGGFLGLDNITVVDRSEKLPDGAILEQSDATGWMGFFCLHMMRIAIELARTNPVYESMATKFFEHFIYIGGAMKRMGGRGYQLWDEEDGFFYDVLRYPSGEFHKFRVRSLVGLIPLYAIDVLSEERLDGSLPTFLHDVHWFIRNRPDLVGQACYTETRDGIRRDVLSIVDRHQLDKLLTRVWDEEEFLSPAGIRSLSKYHQDHPFSFGHGTVHYEPAEADVKIKGGNSNWRGPIWFPTSYLLIESFTKFSQAFGPEFKVTAPAGGGKAITPGDMAREVANRMIGMFTLDAHGRRRIWGGTEKFQQDPLWRDCLLFNEYFHGDNGAGLGANHQTGWTGLVANLIDEWRR
jgi:hypothetical protein